MENYCRKWFLKVKLGGETGNLFLKIKLKKRNWKVGAEKRNLEAKLGGESGKLLPKVVFESETWRRNWKIIAKSGF